MYKILTKVVGSRLSEVLRDTISHLQIAIFGGKQISDTAPVANEVVVDNWQGGRDALVSKLDSEGIWQVSVGLLRKHDGEERLFQ